MPKLKLSIEGYTDNFFDETRLIGITAAIKNYRFCWFLNSLMGYDFRLSPDKTIQLIKKERTYFFPVYQHRVKNSCLHHYLYHNHSDGEYLLPEFRHIDFLWLMKGDCVSDEQCNEMIETIKSIDDVQLAAELTREQIRNKEHMIF